MEDDKNITRPEIKDRELHRIVTTTLVYKPDPGSRAVVLEQSSVHGKQLTTGQSFTYLITRRAMHKKAHPGLWTIPGGGLTVDDYVNIPESEHGPNLWYGALENSLKRELKEEVNLEIGKPELLVDLAFIRPDNIPVMCFSYFAEYVIGDVKIDQDTDGDTIDFAWVTLEQAKDYDLIPGIWDEIRQVDEILKARAK